MPSDRPTPWATVGGWIRQARHAAGLDQQALAEQLWVSQPTISAWERGTRRPQPEQAARLAELLQVDVQELLTMLGYIPARSVPAASVVTAGRVGWLQIGRKPQESDVATLYLHRDPDPNSKGLLLGSVTPRWVAELIVSRWNRLEPAPEGRLVGDGGVDGDLTAEQHGDLPGEGHPHVVHPM